MIAFIVFILWYITPKTCYQSYQNEMAQCRFDFPESTSIGRQYCENLAGIHWRDCTQQHGWGDLPIGTESNSTLDGPK